MKTSLKFKYAVLAAATSLAMGVSTAHAADANTQSTTQMTGKDKATAVGAGTGAVAGAVVGGPVGAIVGAGVGAYVGHEGTDAHGHVSNTRSSVGMRTPNGTIKQAQTALNDKGFNVAVDGRYGPNTQSAVRSFQEQNGLTASGMLDRRTLTALGVRS